MIMDWRTPCNKNVSFLQLIYIFNIISLKIPTGFLHVINNLILKCIITKGKKRAKTILKKKIEGFILPCFKIYKSAVIKTCIWLNDGQIDHWKKTKECRKRPTLNTII